MSEAAHAEPYVLSILVMPAQENTLGVMHGGHMMSWMDMAAWVAATRAVAPEQQVFFKAIASWSASHRVPILSRWPRRSVALPFKSCGL